MGRWEPDAQGRMFRAAIELFDERGYEQTTAGDIAERAGVTERTFFRYFTDKREVLFDGSEAMERVTQAAILDAPADATPLGAALLGVMAAGGLLEDRRDFVVRRHRIIEANPSLRERELLKLERLSGTMAAALGERGVAESAADLVARSAMIVFHVAFTRWVSAAEPRGIVTCVDDVAAELRAVT